jgi:hypothetical protein
MSEILHIITCDTICTSSLTQSVYCGLWKHPSTPNKSFELHLEITIHMQNAQWRISLI